MENNVLRLLFNLVLQFDYNYILRVLLHFFFLHYHIVNQLNAIRLRVLSKWTRYTDIYILKLIGRLLLCAL